MNILWIKSDFPLPADSGGKIRTMHLLTELAKKHTIVFLSYITPEHDRKWLSQMRASGIRVEATTRQEEQKEGMRFYLRVLSRILSSRPYIVNKYNTPEMKARLTRLFSENTFDLVLIDFLEMAWVIDHISDVPTVLFEHNVETLIWRRYHEVETNLFKRAYFGYEKRRMQEFERDSCRKVSSVLTVSDQDGELLMREFGLKKYHSIPTGVDTSYFHPLGKEIRNRLVFCGSMDWMPNIDGFWWFYQSIYPLIRSESPEISFSLVGRRPLPEIVEVGEKDSSVIITGTVADIRPHVAEGQLYIVPLRVGGGTRIKIYEAMAMKKCVLSTTIGAEGLPLTDGVNIALADTPEEFAKRAIELLRDDKKRATIAEAGYRLVTERCSWRKAAETMERALQSVVSPQSKSMKL